MGQHTYLQKVGSPSFYFDLLGGGEGSGVNPGGIQKVHTGIGPHAKKVLFFLNYPAHGHGGIEKKMTIKISVVP